MEKQVISKQRVTDHGEVFTNKREVNAMLDLVKQETERIDSRFLEPACGTGNFLAEILERKLQVVESRYEKIQLEYERNAVLAVSSIYGIDILEDNVAECRNRVLEIFLNRYKAKFKSAVNPECTRSIGNAPVQIVFSEWSPINGSMLKRRDFTFHGLLDHAKMKEMPLFSDLGEDVFIPTPVREFPVVHFLKVADAERH